MNELEIVNTIKSLQKESQKYKDGGRLFIKNLARKVLNISNAQKKYIVRFFIKEIRFNKYDLGGVSLATLEEMNASEIAYNIFQIYNDISEEKNEEWKRNIIESLLKLQYKAPKQFYYDYITEYTKKDSSGYAYYLLVLYCNVDAEMALPLLSEFYTKNFDASNDIKGFIENRISFLIGYFFKNSKDYFPRLIELVSLKNKNAGQHLKKVLLAYFNSDCARKYPNILIEKEKKALQALEI